jgi:hypothetical protein
MERRGFLGGVMATLAAPAVIRPGLLMPVSTLAFPIYGPGGFLTHSMIAREFNRRLQGMVRSGLVGNTASGQSSVDVTITAYDMTCSIEDFALRYIDPAARSIAAHLNAKGSKLSIGQILPIPHGIEAGAVDDRNGVIARAITAYDLFTDTQRLRFDVRHS